jgi:hypothetical protein
MRSMVEGPSTTLRVVPPPHGLRPQVDIQSAMATVFSSV